MDSRPGRLDPNGHPREDEGSALRIYCNISYSIYDVCYTWLD